MLIVLYCNPSSPLDENKSGEKIQIPQDRVQEYKKTKTEILSKLKKEKSIFAIQNYLDSESFYYENVYDQSDLTYRGNKKELDEIAKKIEIQLIIRILNSGSEGKLDPSNTNLSVHINEEPMSSKNGFVDFTYKNGKWVIDAIRFIGD